MAGTTQPILKNGYPKETLPSSTEQGLVCLQTGNQYAEFFGGKRAHFLA
jgi:hypothetical protein